MISTVRVLPLALGLAALTLGGCLDRGGLDPLPDGGGWSGGTSGTATGGTGTGTGGAGADTGSGGASQTGGATGSGGSKGSSGGATSSGGRTGTGTGGRVTGTGGTTNSGGSKGTGGVTGTGGKMMCGGVCDIYCPYGNVLDSNGCPTCKCNAMPDCPQIKCMTGCPTGFTKDEKGCQTCTCNPDPKACAVTDCGTMPPVDMIVCPAGTSGGTSGSSSGSGSGAAIVAPFVCARDATTGKCVWQSALCKACPNVQCMACPNGYEVGPDGCQTCTCRPTTSSVCGSYNSATACAADTSCRWLQPGCSEPALAAAGCFAKATLGCSSDASCGTGHQCLKRFVNPCANNGMGDAACTACAVIETICQ